MQIDLNCDCGESFGRWQIGDGEATLPHVTSANIACGSHVGDPIVMSETVRLARSLEVLVGAHPGYPDFSRELILIGLAGSALVGAGHAAGLAVARKAFADRAYPANGTLRARTLPGAVIEDDQQALAQVLRIIGDGTAVTPEGIAIAVAADTLCVHSDTADAARRAAYLRAGLRAAAIDVVPLNRIVRGAG